MPFSFILSTIHIEWLLTGAQFWLIFMIKGIIRRSIKDTSSSVNYQFYQLKNLFTSESSNGS